jgi:hypothetical protein
VEGVAGGIGVADDGSLHEDFVDRLGHGTAVAAVIREKAPDARVWAVKVFDRELGATGPALVSAIRWARRHRADLINLSLGTANAAHEEALAAEVVAAHASHIVIVAAAPQPGTRWLPGALPGVVRVEADMSIARDRCELAIDSAGEVTLRASCYPRPIPGVSPERNLRGLSFAVANASGLIAAAWPDWRVRLERGALGGRARGR